jgi:hypothetical protein
MSTPWYQNSPRCQLFTKLVWVDWNCAISFRWQFVSIIATKSDNYYASPHRRKNNNQRQMADSVVEMVSVYHQQVFQQVKSIYSPLTLSLRHPASPRIEERHIERSFPQVREIHERAAPLSIEEKVIECLVEVPIDRVMTKEESVNVEKIVFHDREFPIEKIIEKIVQLDSGRLQSKMWFIKKLQFRGEGGGEGDICSY